jgi:hypothetical protein
VKDAKNEAQKEIEEYRKKKDEEYKEYESKVRFPLSMLKHKPNSFIAN